MPETLEFAVNGQAAGAPLIARVYAGMFHDFQQCALFPKLAQNTLLNHLATPGSSYIPCYTQNDL